MKGSEGNFSGFGVSDSQSIEDDEGIFSCPNQTGTPERRLLLAILERAILDFVGNDEKEAKDAESWIFAGNENESQDDDLLTFNGVCCQLDLDPTMVSKIIKAMPRRGKNRVAPWYFDDVKAWRKAA